LTINLTYYHVAKDVPENSPDIAVVIDVLRATTTISWALKNGADSIQVFADLAAFFSFFKGVSGDTALLNRIDFSLLRNLEIIAKYISNKISS